MGEVGRLLRMESSLLEMESIFKELSCEFALFGCRKLERNCKSRGDRSCDEPEWLYALPIETYCEWGDDPAPVTVVEGD